MGLRKVKDSWSLGTFAWHQIVEAAEGGEGGLKSDPGASRLDSVSVSFCSKKQRKLLLPLQDKFRGNHSSRGREEKHHPAPSPAQPLLSSHSPGRGMLQVVLLTPLPQLYTAMLLDVCASCG